MKAKQAADALNKAKQLADAAQKGKQILDAAHEIKERRDQVRRPHYAAPELLATRANEVWSWDITKLLGPAKWTYFYLYVILRLDANEEWLYVAETCAKHGIEPGQLTLHATVAPRCEVSRWRCSWPISE